MNFNVKPFRVDRGWRDGALLARGIENGGRTALRWLENLAGGGIFVGPLRLRPTSKRGGTGGVGFIFESPSTHVNRPRRAAVTQTAIQEILAVNAFAEAKSDLHTVIDQERLMGKALLAVKVFKDKCQRKVAHNPSCDVRMLQTQVVMPLWSLKRWLVFVDILQYIATTITDDELCLVVHSDVVLSVMRVRNLI
ncbi:hypothetical protein PanWU01x14_358520 [Parasponia andersonii]|uniref:Uncharacterized protein n=1 Tax=Parasponia andersonii TaxID=3476 RepID=A0A2P5A893_PARAD|nr:hypothetical protein PanWU01x14_358520 [Parasponia andersonii]